MVVQWLQAGAAVGTMQPGNPAPTMWVPAAMAAPVERLRTVAVVVQAAILGTAAPAAPILGQWLPLRAQVVEAAAVEAAADLEVAGVLAY